VRPSPRASRIAAWRQRHDARGDRDEEQDPGADQEHPQAPVLALLALQLATASRRDAAFTNPRSRSVSATRDSSASAWNCAS
jgi:hypothetical protein